jgi:hypothetical protein
MLNMTDAKVGDGDDVILVEVMRHYLEPHKVCWYPSSSWKSCLTPEVIFLFRLHILSQLCMRRAKTLSTD